MNTFKRNSTRISRQSGFSLLEILISIVITSIGLLGLAGMQVTGLKNNHSAYQNSQATVLAYDLADRMRANVGSISLYQTDVTTPEAVASCKGDGCGAADLAKNDLFDWNADLAAAIPGSSGTVVLSGTTYTVSVSWDEDRNPDTADTSFQLAFQP